MTFLIESMEKIYSTNFFEEYDPYINLSTMKIANENKKLPNKFFKLKLNIPLCKDITI